MSTEPAVLINLIVPYAIRMAGALAFLLLAWTLAGWAGRATSKALKRARVDLTLTLFFTGTARWAVLIMGSLAALAAFGIQITAFAAVIGAAGLAVGLAFQGTLSHFASGIMLLVLRPFAVGDVVTAGGVRGTVTEIQLFSTTFDTPDNRRIFVPNSRIFGDVIENDTYHATRRVDVPVGAEYSADIDATRAALTRALERVDGIREEPAPQVYLKELGGSSVDWVVRGWCATADFWEVRQELVRAVKLELDAAGIGIPFPQLDVHLDGTPGGRDAGA